MRSSQFLEIEESSSSSNSLFSMISGMTVFLCLTSLEFFVWEVLSMSPLFFIFSNGVSIV